MRAAVEASAGPVFPRPPPNHERETVRPRPSSRWPARAAAASSASAPATLASSSSPVPGLLPSLGRVSTDGGHAVAGVVLFGRRGEQLAGVFRVADHGLGVEAEHRGQVQRVGAAGEGFLELPVDAEPLQGGGPVRANIGNVTNTISGGTQQGPVLQGRDFSNITFGAAPVPPPTSLPEDPDAPP